MFNVVCVICFKYMPFLAKELKITYLLLINLNKYQTAYWHAACILL